MLAGGRRYAEANAAAPYNSAKTNKTIIYFLYNYSNPYKYNTTNNNNTNVKRMRKRIRNC